MAPSLLAWGKAGGSGRVNMVEQRLMANRHSERGDRRKAQERGSLAGVPGQSSRLLLNDASLFSNAFLGPILCALSRLSWKAFRIFPALLIALRSHCKSGQHSSRQEGPDHTMKGWLLVKFAPPDPSPDPCSPSQRLGARTKHTQVLITR